MRHQTMNKPIPLTNASFTVTWFADASDDKPHEITVVGIDGAELGAFLASTEVVKDLGVRIPRYVAEVESMRRHPTASAA